MCAGAPDRVVVAFALYVLAKVLVTVLGQAAGWPEGHAMAVPLAALATALVLAGGVPVSLRLGWYRRAPAVA